MTSFPRRAALAAVICAGLAAVPALARNHDSIRISDAWCPPPPPGAPTAAGYLTITNTGRGPDRLTGASSPVAASVQLHRMTTQGRIMRMRAVTGGLPVAPGQVRAIQPGGELHLMLIGLRRPLKAGDHAPITLTFAHAGPVRVDFAVRPQGGAAPALHTGPHGHMNMGSH